MRSVLGRICRVGPAACRRASSFSALEEEAWGDAGVAAAYTAMWCGMTSQTVQPLLRAAAVEPGQRVLDACTGPGVVAQAAAAMGCRVTALDFSPAFLDQCAARCRGLPVACVLGDAASLPVADSTLDAVVCNYGVLHLPAPERFFAEAHRVLRPGGSLSFSVWAPPPANEAFARVLDAVAEHGDPSVPLPDGPPFFGFAEPATVAEALRAAGFDGIRTEVVPQQLRLAGGGDDLCGMVLEGTARTRALLLAQRPEDRSAICAAIARESPGCLAMPAVVSRATA